MAELLGQSLTEEDTTEAEAELAALEAEMEPEPELPSVPTTKVRRTGRPLCVLCCLGRIVRLAQMWCMSRWLACELCAGDGHVK
jgi:hypothetical protein